MGCYDTLNESHAPPWLADAIACFWSEVLLSEVDARFYSITNSITLRTVKFLWDTATLELSYHRTALENKASLHI